MRSTRPGSPVESAWISVSIRPGETASTRIPSPASSFESPIVRELIAPFEAAYQTYSPGLPRPCRDGRDVHEGPASGQPPRGFARHKDCACHIHVDAGPDRLGGNLGELARRTRDPRIVDDVANGPKRCGRVGSRECTSRSTAISPEWRGPARQHRGIRRRPARPRPAQPDSLRRHRSRAAPRDGISRHRCRGFPR